MGRLDAAATVRISRLARDPLFQATGAGMDIVGVVGGFAGVTVVLVATMLKALHAV